VDSSFFSKVPFLIIRAVQMNPVQGMLCVKKQRLLKIVPVGNEAGIPLMYQPMKPFHKEFPGLLL
jgi:hypothetical protein